MYKIINKPISKKAVKIGPGSGCDNIIAAIETSCDETCFAIVKNGREVLANVVASQIDIHKEYGGVVPEVAAREHYSVIDIVIKEGFKQANIKPQNLSAISCTVGPGLVGSLLVGLNAAKAFSLSYDLPFIGVNHLYSHVCANYIDSDLTPPFIALLISGGHTQIIKVDSFDEQFIIGETIDDAIGEVYDKIARILGIPYPGGANLDKLAQIGNKNSFNFPEAKVGKYDFSFSGLKTSVFNTIKKQEHLFGNDIPKNDIAASFQEGITNTLFKKTKMAALEYNINKIVLAGGVACNSEVRSKFFELKKTHFFEIYAPEIKYCTDNASMVGSCAYFHSNTYNNLNTEAFSRCLK